MMGNELFAAVPHGLHFADVTTVGHGLVGVGRDAELDPGTGTSIRRPPTLSDLVEFLPVRESRNPGRLPKQGRFRGFQ